MLLRAHKNVSGFTIVELLVTVGIFVLMTVLIISRYGAFNSGTLLTNLAYDVALTVRTAQTYGISVKNVDASNDDFNSAYGVHFDISDPKSFQLFSDKDKDGLFDYPTGGDLRVSSYNIRQGFDISSLCVNGPAGDDCLITVLNVSFKRPDPDAVICTDTCPSAPYHYAKVLVQPADGSVSRAIMIRQNGQISVE